MRVQRFLEKVTAAFVMMAGLAGCGGSNSAGTQSPLPGPVGTKMGGAVQGISLALTNGATTFAGTAGSADGTGARCAVQPAKRRRDGRHQPVRS